MSFRINHPRVLHETVENETIIIDFEYGAYYSVRGTADAVWRCIAEQGASREALVAHLVAHYIGDPAQMAADIDDFLATLLRNELVVASEGSKTATPAALSPERQRPYTPPVLEAYTDLQEILLLDPIHDVGEEEGWPIRKREDEVLAHENRVSHAGD